MKKTITLFLLNYFRVLAKLQLGKNRPIIIGVTGSAGKTTVMNAVAAVLQERYQVKISEKANSQSGLSLNILGLNPSSFSVLDWLRLVLLAPIKVLTNWEKFQVYIAEMGIDGPDEPANMEYLLKIVSPKIGVFTSLTPVHAQAFDHLVTERNVNKRATALLTAIAREKAKIITRLPVDGTAVYNADDLLLARECGATRANQVTFGKNPSAVVRLLKTSWKNQGTSFTLKHGSSEATIVLEKYLLPEHFGLSFASAAAVGATLGISLTEATQAISRNFVLPPGRASLIAAVHRSTILDSSYNSAPAPLLDFLELLEQLKRKKDTKNSPPTRILGLLGDMRELGKLSGYEHARIAKPAGAVLDAIYLIGPEMRKHALPVLKKKKLPVLWFASAAAAAEKLKKDLQPNDLLLVKGSQNTILLEIAVEKLMANPLDAPTLLCRRGKFWDRQRKILVSSIY